MYDSIRSGSTSPQFSRTMPIWRAKKGCSGSPRCAAASGPPSNAPTIDAVSSGLTRSYSEPLGSTWTSGPLAAEPHAADLADLDPMAQPSLRDGRVQALLDLHRPGPEAGRGSAAANPHRLTGRSLRLGDRVQISEIHRPVHPFMRSRADSGLWFPETSPS